MNREIICINCPLGSRLEVTIEEGKVAKVTGNTCGKGVEYAQTECLNPTRTVTTTVSIKNTLYALLPVRTSKPIPKDLVTKCVQYLRRIEVKAPVRTGEIIVENILGTEADIIATKNLEAL